MKNVHPDWEEGFSLQEEFKKILQEPMADRTSAIINM